MASQTLFAPGARLSYDGELCTVRYVGEVQGTKGQWLGVEWDDPTRGKHSGEHRGVKYFQCKIQQPTAGSFIRPGRPADKPLSFLEAAHEKYVHQTFPSFKGDGVNAATENRPIEISGKIVEEVGFEKIRKLLSELQDLRIVLLDGLRIQGVLVNHGSADERGEELQRIGTTCPNIIELDLSRNLLEDLEEVADICGQLKCLRSLKLDGNRFENTRMSKSFTGISSLSLDGTLMEWGEIATVSNRFPDLLKLSLLSNQISIISQPISDTIKDLSLETNNVTSIDSLRHLASLPRLGRLSLRRNDISTVYSSQGPGVSHRDNAPLIFSSTLVALDISLNKINDWATVDSLPSIFPGLKNLRISNNPLFDQPPAPSRITNLPEKPMTIDEAYMLTLARLSKLEVLNYGEITDKDRNNGELYYLSLIRKELSASPASAEKHIIASHPRYQELCEIYGTPEIQRSTTNQSGKDNSRTLAARLVEFTFYIPPSFAQESGPHSTRAEFKKEIPRSFDVYRIKTMVSRHFSLPPLRFKLFWETDEWDPVAQGTAEDKWDSSDEGENQSYPPNAQNQYSGAGGAVANFVRREEELIDSTRAVEHWFNTNTREVRVRVEVF